jgi:GNAT superfamily N-acetyltransferase
MQVRNGTVNDINELYLVAHAMGKIHEKNYFETCFSEQKEKKRNILVAEENGKLLGYGQLIWLPLYAPFRRLEIPEIQDMNVVPQARRQGIGAKIIDAFEEMARQAGKTDIGIAVGLYADYGPAQRLYVRKGYIPDGAGVCYDDVPVRQAELRPVDDMLTLKFIKNIQKIQ